MRPAYDYMTARGGFLFDILSTKWMAKREARRIYLEHGFRGFGNCFQKLLRDGYVECRDTPTEHQVRRVK